MEIKGIGNEIASAYSNIGKSQATQDEFKRTFDEALVSKDDDELKQACESFESYYVQQLFKSMRKTIPESKFLDSGNEKEIYTDMLDEEYSKVISKSHGYGIADALYKQLSTKKTGL